jgi:hypothetical protein
MTLTSAVALLGLLLIVLNVAGVMITRTFGIYSVINIAIITAGLYHLILMRLGEDASFEAFVGRLLVAFAAGAVTYLVFRRHTRDKEREAHR